MFDLFYNIIFIPISLILIKIIRQFNKKLDEREKFLKSHQVSIDKLTNGFTIWFHASSMGEFEQAKPIIELFKKNYPDTFIVCSFFSPSGFNTQKNYKYADYICYLPFDTIENANDFIFQIEPDIAIFIRYDVWRNYLQVLKKRGIPSLLINATQPSNGFFRNFPITRNFIRSNMSLFTEIITCDKVHTEYFQSIGIMNVQTLTDTRFDRIAEFVNGAQANLVFPKEFISVDCLVLVAGSVWNEDIDIISEGITQFKTKSSQKIKVIYAPHEPTQEHLAYLISKLESYVLLSEILKDISEGKTHEIIEKILHCDILVDSIGFLLRLYNYADLAYIGGAFGAGIHSVTEAAGYGLPLVTGPNLSKSTDAKILKEIGSLTTIKNTEEFLSWLETCVNEPKVIEIQSHKSRNYIFENIGSTEKVFKIIESYL